MESPIAFNHETISTSSLSSNQMIIAIQHSEQQIQRQLEPSTVIQTLAEIFSKLLLFVLIFGMSATVDSPNLKRQLRNRYAIATGVAMQFLIMPLLGFLAVLSLKDHGLTPAMGITLLMVTASPGGSYSNWWCSLFNADLALSVAMTALSTILSIGLLPANLMLYSHAVYGLGGSDGDDDDGSSATDGNTDILASVDFGELFLSIGIVIAAIVSGLYTSILVDSAKFRRFANAMGSVAGIALIVFSFVFSSFGTSSSTAEGEEESTPRPWNQHWSFYLGVASPCIVGLVLANVIARFARLEKPEVVTLSVECCYQNVGIATSAALAMFDDHAQTVEALAVPLLYGIVEAVILGLYCLVAWKLGWTKAPKEEQICVVMSKTYEVEDEEDNLIEEIMGPKPPEGFGGTGSGRRRTPEVKDVEHGTNCIDHGLPIVDGKDLCRTRFESTDITVTSSFSNDRMIHTSNSRDRTSTAELEENLGREIETSATDTSRNTNATTDSRLRRIAQSRFVRRLFFNRSMTSSNSSDSNENTNVTNGNNTVIANGTTPIRSNLSTSGLDTNDTTITTDRIPQPSPQQQTPQNNTQQQTRQRRLSAELPPRPPPQAHFAPDTDRPGLPTIFSDRQISASSIPASTEDHPEEFSV